MAQFPVNLNLQGRPVLVVGGGRIALRKVQQVLLADADITVLAPSVVDGLRELPVTIMEREYERGDAAGYRLVITATGVQEVDQRIFDDCEARNIWVNSADDPERCTFTLPAVFRRGDLMVTSSTGGASPGLSSFVRSRLESAIGPEFADVVTLLAAERARFHADGVSTEDVDWAPLIAKALDDAGVASPLFVTAASSAEAVR